MSSLFTMSEIMLDGVFSGVLDNREIINTAHEIKQTDIEIHIIAILTFFFL